MRPGRLRRRMGTDGFTRIAGGPPSLYRWLLRRGRPFLQLLFEQFVFRGQLLHALLKFVNPYRRAVPRRAIGIQLTTKVLVFAPEELDLFFPLLVLLKLPAIHGKSKLTRLRPNRAWQNPAAR